MSDAAPELKPLPDHGDLMPFADWLESVNDGFFIDYDGHGHMATKDGYSPKHPVYPSQWKNKVERWPAWATHVVWYNR